MRNQKTIIVSAFILLLLLFSLFSFFASSAGKAHGISAKAAVLYDPKTEAVLYERNIHTRLPIASTTKIMTALIILEALPLDTEITVCQDAVGIEGSSAYFKGGEIYTAYDMLHILLLRSANDAATQLAITVGGDIKSFSELMNKRAEELGLKDTSFENPTGLDGENHYSSAYDLALITAEAMKNPTFCEIVSKYKHEATDISTGVKSLFVNHNKLLKMYDGCIGVKTGYTQKSGRCLVSAAKSGEDTLIAVTLNAPSDWNDHIGLYTYGFGLMESFSLFENVKSEYQIPIISSDTNRVNAKLSHNISFTAPKNAKIEYILNIPSYLVAPIAVGDKVGDVKIKINGKILYEIPILATTSAHKH